MDSHAENCTWCESTLRAASRLREMKLGKHERRQLLEAGSPGDDAAPIMPSGPSHDHRTSSRRAVDKLRRADLVVIAKNTMRVTMDANPDLLRALGRKYAVLRFMSRTVLGDEVVAEYRRELETPGMRVRWLAVRRQAIKDRALARCPHRS